MFGRGKRKGPVELGEVFQQDEGAMEDMWDVDVSQDVVWETVRAWCLAERGIIPHPADSHGICASHSAQVLQSYREGKVHQYS